MVQSVMCQDHTKTFLFVGSYTEGQKGDGIHVYDFKNEDGALSEVAKISDIVNASYLALSPNGQYLYTCSKTKLERDGSVSSFKIDTVSGRLTFINEQPSGGRNPVHINTDRGNEYVINANFTDAGLAIYKIKEGGGLAPFSQLMEFSGSSITKGRQDEAHLHSTIFSPDGHYLLAMDLGTDMIHTFEFDVESEDNFVSMEHSSVNKVIGSGPRHFVFHPNKLYGYCINEINGTISSYLYEDGMLTPNGVVFSYSRRLDKYQSADIHISPDGRFLYASNRGDDENSISIFGINEIDGTLQKVGHTSTYGIHPRSFVIDPSGNYLLVANQITGNIVIFRRNKESGLLTKLEHEIQLKAPASLKMRTYQKE